MLATNESTKPWLDEGFTSYAEDFVMNALFPKMIKSFYNAIQSYVRFVKSGKEEPAVWLADHHDNGTAYTVASYTKGELFLVELGYIVGEENLSKILKNITKTGTLNIPQIEIFSTLHSKFLGWI